MPTRSSGIHEFEIYLPPHSLRKRVGTRKNISKKNAHDANEKQKSDDGKSSYKKNEISSDNINTTENKTTQSDNQTSDEKNNLTSYTKDEKKNKQGEDNTNESTEEKQKDENNKEIVSNQKSSSKDNEKEVEFKPRDYLKVLKPENNDEDKNTNKISEQKKQYSQQNNEDEKKKKQEIPFYNKDNINSPNNKSTKSSAGVEPKSLSFALLLLWVSLFIDVIIIIMEPTISTPSSAIASSSTTLTSLMLFLNGFLLLQIAYHKNWARLFFFIISCIELFPKFSNVFVAPSKMNVSILLTIGMIVLRIYGLHLIFTEPRNKCFKRERKTEGYINA
ncbi:MAG: hypothetical protein V4525_16000 [Pseudomonadota bacterium]